MIVEQGGAVRLSELFSLFGANWPAEIVTVGWPPGASDTSGLVAQIEDAIRVHDVVTDLGRDGTIAITGELKVETAPAETEPLSQLFPNLRFVLKPELTWSSAFRCSVAPDGNFTLQIDDLPLEVRLPSDLLAQHPNDRYREIDPEISLSGRRPNRRS